MTYVLAVGGGTIFLVFLIVMIAILAYTAFSRAGQSDISQHPVDGRTDVPPGSGRPDRISSAESPEPSPGRGADTGA